MRGEREEKRGLWLGCVVLGRGGAAELAAELGLFSSRHELESSLERIELELFVEPKLSWPPLFFDTR